MDDIPLEGLNIIYCRSSGAGGQHVNHVNTKVHIRFNVQNATWLSEEIKKKLIEQVCELCFLKICQRNKSTCCNVTFITV